MTYLIDTSVYARADQPLVRERLLALPPWDIRVSVTLLLEVGWSARDAAEHERLMTALERYTLAEASGWAQRRAVQVQGLLAQSGWHRTAGLADLLTAAIAEQHDLSVLHYDRDFDTIAKLTGQSTEWVCPPGSVD